MGSPIAMTMAVKMRSLAPQPPQDIRTKAKQHEAYGSLQRLRQALGKGPPKH